jgi:hypothetical protein
MSWAGTVRTAQLHPVRICELCRHEGQCHRRKGVAICNVCTRAMRRFRRANPQALVSLESFR